MSRLAIINKHVETQGFTTSKFSKDEIKSQPLVSWIHFFHKPYTCDWYDGEDGAVKKARDRKWIPPVYS